MSPALLAIRQERARLLAEKLGAEAGVPAEDILGAGHDREVVALRHRLWRMLIDSGLSTNVVSQVVGRSYATVYQAMRKLEAKDGRHEDGK